MLIRKYVDFKRIPVLSLLSVFILASAGLAAAQDLPLGDGHITDHPAIGYVFPCRFQFRQGGARHEGPWFHGDTWNPAEKPHVEGHVMWPQASFSITQHNKNLVVKSNGLPVDEPTGIFPISPNDPAYKYDTNPNSVKKQHLDFDIPAKPVRAEEPGCLPMGMIGITTTGVALYSALDDAGRDAAAHEIQDACDGHPQGKGQYHYHSSSPCLPGAKSDSLVGWALDGYPILGMRDKKGKILTDADLDVCHGRAEKITINGRTYNYAYRLTREYPYTLGCFMGKVDSSTRQAIHQEMGPPRRRR